MDGQTGEIITGGKLQGYETNILGRLKGMTSRKARGEGNERKRHLVLGGSVICFVNSVRSRKNTGIIGQ